MPDPLVTRLAALDSCAVSDAVNALGGEGVGAGLRCLTGSVDRAGETVRIAGRVVTVQLGPPAEETPGRHLCTAAVEASGPGDVIVVAGGRTDAGGWGGILSRAALHRGVEGVVVDGAARDVDESREIGFPVFARGAVPRTARGRQVETAWDVPVSVGGVQVAPGDLVLADGSGVVFVPAATAEAVLDRAEYVAAKEAAMAERIAAGDPVSRVMSADYETMLTGTALGAADGAGAAKR